MNLSRFTRSFGFRQTMLLTAGCFALIALGVTAVTVVSRKYSRQGTRQTETLTGQFLPGLVTLARLQDAALNLKSITYQFALAKDEAAMKEQKQAFQTATVQVTRSVAQLKLMAHDEPTQRLIAAFAADVQIYRERAEKFQAELGAGDFEKAMATLDQQISPAQQKIETQLHALSERYFELSDDAGTRTTAVLAQSDRFGLLATIVLAGFTLLCLGLSLAATRALVAQMQKRDAERQAAQDTLEKRVEQRTAELRDANRNLQAIDAVLNAASIIARTDQCGIITHINDNFCRIAGYSREELLGQNHRILKSDEHPDAFFRELWRTIANGEVWRGEIKNHAKNGRSYWVDTTIGPMFDEGGKPKGFMAIRTDITERKRAEAELKNAHKELLETSRQAGMAEVATSVLHNVGNVLNSVNVASTCVADGLRKSKGASLTRVVALLREHEADLGAFFATDARAKQLPGFLARLADHLAAERTAALQELGHLQKNIEHIKDIVAMQQTYAKASGVTETVQITDLIEDTLRMNVESFAHHHLRVVREFAEVPPVTVEKHKVLQILVNLVRNAKHACDAGAHPDKTLTLRVFNGEGSVKIAVSDNGVGIPAENLTRIFNHGFTTKKNGHGFGLHSGALAAQEMGGALRVESKGSGEGATFTLELPVQRAKLDVA